MPIRQHSMGFSQPLANRIPPGQSLCLAEEYCGKLGLWSVSHMSQGSMSCCPHSMPCPFDRFRAGTVHRWSLASCLSHPFQLHQQVSLGRGLGLLDPIPILQHCVTWPPFVGSASCSMCTLLEESLHVVCPWECACTLQCESAQACICPKRPKRKGCQEEAAIGLELELGVGRRHQGLQHLSP